MMKITDVLVAEHTIFLGVFDEVERVLPSLTTIAEVGTMARIVEGILRKHASRESELAYAALDHALANQGALKQMHQDHHELDQRLKRVHQTQHCSEARRLLKASLDASREHFQLEEKTLFPMLEKTLATETLADLGKSWLEREGSARHS